MLLDNFSLQLSNILPKQSESMLHYCFTVVKPAGFFLTRIFLLKSSLKSLCSKFLKILRVWTKLSLIVCEDSGHDLVLINYREQRIPDIADKPASTSGTQLSKSSEASTYNLC